MACLQKYEIIRYVLGWMKVYMDDKTNGSLSMLGEGGIQETMIQD